MEVTQVRSTAGMEQREGQTVTEKPLFQQSDGNRNTESTSGDKLSNFIEISDGAEIEPCANLSTEASKQSAQIGSRSDKHSRERSVEQRGQKDSLLVSSGLESKLRVSVYDHRLIPKKFISGRILASRNTESDMNITNGAKTNLSGITAHTKMKSSESGEGPKRKAMNLPFAVRKNKCTGKPGTGISQESPDSDGVRTRFDDLLRGLIGDVNDMQVESSPMTISSGYESDYMQTKENEIDDIFNKTKQNKENVKKGDEVPTDYFSMSETYPHSELTSPMKENREFMSLPAFPTQPVMERDIPRVPESKEAPVMRSARPEKDSNGFSYAQRHNYKLTKVTRSMYEIIHDLQNVDKNSADGRKRSRKGRRSVQENTAISDGSSSARENRTFGRFNSAVETSNSNTSSLSRNRENSLKALSGAVVRCVRRPLGSSDSNFRSRTRISKTSNSDGNTRLGSTRELDNTDRVQTDLRNLLCDTGEMTGHSNNDNEPGVPFSGFSRLERGVHQCVTDLNENKIIPNSRLPVRDIPFSDVPVRPSLNAQFANRSKPEDHVYETIPGDEKLYEEWKKMRATSKMPRIRRFTTVPDLPGTFVPKEPPALPERKYLNPIQKDNDNYIFMGDGNSNVSSTSSASDRPDSGYASVSSDKMLDSKPIQCYPIQTDNFVDVNFRNDETSDGYCSIDNLSLLREPVMTSYPEQFSSVSSSHWFPHQVNGFHRYPPNQNSNFFHSQQNRFHTNGYPESFEAERKLRGIGLLEHRKSDGSDSDSTLVPSAIDRDAGKPIVQATYV